MHKLTIKSTEVGEDISLDGFTIDGVVEYNLKSSAGKATELSLKIVISSADFCGNGTTNYRNDNSEQTPSKVDPEELLIAVRKLRNFLKNRTVVKTIPNMRLNEVIELFNQ